MDMSTFGTNLLACIWLMVLLWEMRLRPGEFNVSQIFVNIDQHLCKSRSLSANMCDTGRPRHLRTRQFEEEILHAFEETPTTSTRKVARQIGVDRRLVWNILRDNELHPYHKQRLQALPHSDYPFRIAFYD
ncbi:hypothetical protein PR048_011849 [Dryococelus australis]|uniref:Uncharacterized protein n=1 Tax=Dryococelus australis TaxID=614101 RepID=A0ABQ9HNH6_9NEOP|nr:hypothetical protein PR048_011849 [Dryococelus australis]